MKKFGKNYVTMLSFIAAVATCLFFFVYIITLVSTYSASVNAQASERAAFYAEEQAVLFSRQTEDLLQDTERVAERLIAADTEADFREQVKLTRLQSEDDLLVDVLYFKDDTLISWSGLPVTGYEDVDALQGETSSMLSRVFQYDNRVMSVAAYAPGNGVYFDGLVLVYDRLVFGLSAYAYEGETQIPCVKTSSFTLLCRHDGKVLDRIENGKYFVIGNETLPDGLFKKLFSDAQTRREVEAAMSQKGANSFLFDKNGENYVLTVYGFGKDSGNLSIVSCYKVRTVYGEGYTVMSSINAALVGLAVVMGLMIASILFIRLRARRKMYLMEMVDPLLRCATPKRFEKNAEEILKRRNASSFAIVSLRVNNWGYLVERFTQPSADKLTKYVDDAVRHAMYLEETYAHAGEGEFLLLLHFRDKQSLTERLKGLSFRISDFNGFEEEEHQIGVSCSVYEIERQEKLTVRAMLEKLKMAKEAATVQTDFFTYNFYEDVLHKNYVRKAEIEGKMDQALKDSEFHLFYQPKYNLKTKNMDGCEILVRWYDPKISQYRLPSEFLPVFEENGFIAQLDHFVFYKACENLADRVNKGQLCYPVSVNVSRVTAIQRDFIDYYTRIKRKFGIKDNFITLEFTESFAYENYEFLASIVSSLHQNGILCSIDDFGTGYSSYNILKSIRMDEIKLDRFFLSKGLSPERDQTLLQSVIDMVKKLGMKVTQEGVETKEDLFRLEELGCEVIQGYYFAKPMKYSDYCEFVEKNFLVKQSAQN